MPRLRATIAKDILEIVGTVKRIWHVLCHGWQTVAHVHTAWWLLVDVFRVAAVPALITGLITSWGEHSAAILAVVFVITFTACGLLWLAGLGHQSASHEIPTSPSTGGRCGGRPDTGRASVLIWGAPPDWQKLRTVWWLWLVLGSIVGAGVSHVSPLAFRHENLPPVLTPTPEITWGDPAITFGMQRAGSDYLITVLEFHGKNTSGHGMYKIVSMITSDRGSSIDLFMNNGGQWLSFDDIDALPNEAHFVIGCPIRKEKPHCGWETEGMRPEQLIKFLGSFSVSFYADGRSMTGLHFSIEELESKIREAKKLPLVDRKN
jgi:hypothetical protein